MLNNIRSALGNFRVSHLIMTVTCIIATLLVAGAESAPITVTAASSANFPGNAVNGTFSIPYQVQNPNSVVVFGAYIDAGGGALTSLGFGTGAGDQAANAIITQDRSSLTYFLNPSTGAGLSFNGATGAANGSSAGYAIWELAGVDLAALVSSASGANNSLQITTTSANSFITDMLGVNDFGITNVEPDADAVQSEISQVFVVPGGGQLAAGQATVGSAGTYNLGWLVEGGSGNYGELAFAFAPVVPEPATFGLTLIAGMALVACRRRD
jgi:hypothetical protein